MFNYIANSDTLKKQLRKLKCSDLGVRKSWPDGKMNNLFSLKHIAVLRGEWHRAIMTEQERDGHR